MSFAAHTRHLINLQVCSPLKHGHNSYTYIHEVVYEWKFTSPSEEGARIDTYVYIDSGTTTGIGWVKIAHIHIV